MIATREELEELYFQDFQSHWPLVDKETYLQTPQPDMLVAAVLVAGLWMSPSPEARVEADAQHDTLLLDLTKRLV